MDANNLAICVAPTLVRGQSIRADLELCRVTTAASMSAAGSRSNPQPPSPNALQDGPNTLGNIIVLCIQRYYEIFDELPDPTEAQQMSRVASPQGDAASHHSSSPSMQSQPSSNKRDSSFFHDEEDFDDAMLVMPLGLNASGSRNANAPSSPPSAWAPGAGPSAAKYKPRHRNTKSRDSRDLNIAARSMHTTGAASNASAYASPPARAKSTISIEKGGPLGTSRRGSIAIGRGTTRKGAGSAVEAIGLTASGFFTPPASAPPVPSPPRK